MVITELNVPRLLIDWECLTNSPIANARQRISQRTLLGLESYGNPTLDLFHLEKKIQEKRLKSFADH